MLRFAIRSGHPLSGHPLGVVIIDLDDFKGINGRCTDLVGDQVLQQAATVCDGMRCTLAQHDWNAIVTGIAVTASFGIATTGSAGTVSELVRSADEQLLKAKRSGKNRVLCSTAEVA